MSHLKRKKKNNSKKERLFKTLLLIVLFSIVIGVLLFIFSDKTSAPSEPGQKKITYIGTETEKSKTIKTFTSKEFQDLYEQFAYPNTQTISEDTPITGNIKADQRIIKLATDRGYKIRSAPVSDNFKQVDKNIELQILAANDWEKLEAAAKKDGIKLKLVAGYRSAEDQLAIFLSRINGVSQESIANGSADKAIDVLLQTTAPPGYSRHHSGYTIDLGCIGEEGLKFENSTCYEWISKDNYINAKKSGWIPSYPDDAKKQGPEPEAWEYVWVGVESLYK